MTDTCWHMTSGDSLLFVSLTFTFVSETLRVVGVFSLRMAESEQKPLLDDEEQGDAPLPPPPPYEPKNEETAPPPPPPPNYTPSMPLPTYTQSEKYERDGVLEYHHETNRSDDDEESEEMEHQTTSDSYRGGCCEFTIFFLVCAVFSVVAFIFTFCVATTIAAQSGALAGLGVAFISKPIIFEMYKEGFVKEQLKINYCGVYYTGNDTTLCIQRSYSVMRLFFWLIGMLGLFLLYKGTSNFVKSRGTRRN